MRRALTAGAVTILSMSSFLWTGVAPVAAQDGAPSISVVRIPGQGEVGCLPAGQGAAATISETATEVVMTVVARYPVCGEVTAAIYAMPGNRLYPWPQVKRESETFPITPGTTVVRFRKGCEPQQFDLVTGPTPQTIRPDTGPMHGPLLFELPWTGVQHWGECTAGTTSTTAASTTTTAVAVAGISTTTTPGESVAGVTQVRADDLTGSTVVGGSNLATTGADVALLARLAVVLLAAGATLAFAGALRRVGRRHLVTPGLDGSQRPSWLPNL